MIPAADYHGVVVLPSLDAFYAQSGDLRLAMHAAASLVHAIRYAHRSRDPDPTAAGRRAEAYKRDLAGRCFSFRVVEGFAAAAEQGTLDRADLRGLSSGGRGAFAPAFHGRPAFENAPFGDADDGIDVRCEGHGWVALARALRVACSMMETELPELIEPPAAPAPANMP